jgi:hypothetical protein
MTGTQPVIRAHLLAIAATALFAVLRRRGGATTDLGGANHRIGRAGGAIERRGDPAPTDLLCDGGRGLASIS